AFQCGVFAAWNEGAFPVYEFSSGESASCKHHRPTTLVEMRFCYASDQSLLVYFGEEISLDAHHRVRKLLRSLERDRLDGVRNLHPAYCSLLLQFDPCRTSHGYIESTLRDRIAAL